MVTVTACGGDDGEPQDTDAATSGATSAASDPDGGSSPTTSPTGATMPGVTVTDGTSADDTAGTTGEPIGEIEAMCMRWNEDRVDLSEGTWSGSVAACDPGDMSPEGRANALRLVNLYRALAELPQVTTDPGRDAGTQACAVMMEANGMLSHTPPMGWACWTAEGADSAGASNISSGPAVDAVDRYMIDGGNETTLGHRRWILNDDLGPIGIGSTDGASCMHVVGGTGELDRPWTAYPPPGPFPLEAVAPLGFGETLDQTGWSIQSDVLDLNAAQVNVTTNGEDRPVVVTPLQAGIGSDWAISIIPQGWTAQPDTTYHVSVTGVAEVIEYDVQFVVCADF